MKFISVIVLFLSLNVFAQNAGNETEYYVGKLVKKKTVEVSSPSPTQSGTQGTTVKYKQYKIELKNKRLIALAIDGIDVDSKMKGKYVLVKVMKTPTSGDFKLMDIKLICKSDLSKYSGLIPEEKVKEICVEK